MPVFTHKDEVDDVAIVEQHIGIGRHLSRDSGVSEEDFYEVLSSRNQPDYFRTISALTIMASQI